MQRFPSVLFSIIFHLSLVVLVVFWPAPEPAPLQPLTGAMVQGLVTIGKAGGPAKVAAEDTSKKAPTVAKVAEKDPAPEPKSTAPSRVEPEQPVTSVKEVKPVEKPQEPPVPVEKTPTQKQVKEPEAVKIAEKREEKPKEKPKEKPAEKPKEKPKDKPKEKPKEKPQDKPKPSSQQKGSAATQALADLNKDEKKTPPRSGTTSSGSSGGSAAAALKALESELGGGDGSGMGTGSGYGEAGYGDSALIGSYTDSLVSRIKPNWSWTGLAERRALEARFLIKVAPDGTIESHKLIQSSGNSSFDASVTKAIVLTTQVEPPPAGIPNGEIMVVFRPDAMM